MINRREFLQASVAVSAIFGLSGFGNWSSLAAQQAMTQDDLLAFQDYGNVTLIHITDIHAQTKPIWFREPEINIGVGEAKGRPPHLTGRDFIEAFKIKPASAEAYALTCEDFEALGKTYGKMGGMDRVATVVKAIRAARPEAILLDGGDTWHGSMTSLLTKGQDMVNIMNALKVDAMTSHWEWTYGTERLKEIVDALPFSFLGANIYDSEWNEPAFEPYTFFERGGAKIAVIGQAFPYMPIANPGWMFPEYSFGIREERMQQMVDEVRSKGADLVVCLSHNGFDVDRKMVSRVKGIDVILTGHTHDAVPEPIVIGETILIASGSNGKFVSRVDLDVRDGRMMGYRHKLIPVFSDVIAPDPEMAALVDDERAPHKEKLEEKIGTTESLLPPRQFQRNLGQPDLRCHPVRAGCGDRNVSRRALGHDTDARRRNHPRGYPQRHLDDLRRLLPDRDDRRDAEDHPRRRRRQPVQHRPLLSTGATWSASAASASQSTSASRSAAASPTWCSLTAERPSTPARATPSPAGHPSTRAPRGRRSGT